MPTLEVSLPDRMESEIDRLVEQGEFLNRERAIEELLTRGISVYNTDESSTDEPYAETFTQPMDDQRDPAARNDPEDDPRSL
ncbi:MAG: ribbon-helix-helix domain-containing protein [Haloarculaceae archaeon]